MMMVTIRRQKRWLLMAIFLAFILFIASELSLNSFSVSKRFMQKQVQNDHLGDVESVEKRHGDVLQDSTEQGEGQQDDDQHEDKQIKVLIYSRARTGSSFLGSLFDQSPSVLYFFEPLWRQKALLNRSIAETAEAAAGELSMLFKCNLSVSWAADLRHEMTKRFLTVQGRGLFFQQVFKELKVNNRSTNEELQQRVNGHCGNQSHVVAKCIDRLESLKLIEPLWDDRFFVIYLVRDPRAVFVSRSNVQIGASFNVSFDFFCGSSLGDMEFLRETNSTSAKNNVLIVRYEDLINDPLTMTRILFNFVHLPIHSDVSTWIHALSQTRTSKDKFSLRRDPFHIVEKWRYTLNATMLDVIQKNPFCRSYMQLFGYIPLQFRELQDLRVHAHQTWYNGDEYAQFIRKTIIKM